MVSKKAILESTGWIAEQSAAPDTRSRGVFSFAKSSLASGAGELGRYAFKEKM
ncbi:MAG: hypothetical protein U9R60_11250 [Bacteroidota bacterium]|nr:hypothetical protein [Bacteroidota bacterium]